MDQYLEDSDKLESKISSLESSVEAELKEVNMLSSRCTELRGLIDELTKLNAALTEENQQVEAKAQAISDILENEREVNGFVVYANRNYGKGTVFDEVEDIGGFTAAR
jgi:DNA repair exonuclease SbcCD ATPase subunit